MLLSFRFSVMLFVSLIFLAAFQLQAQITVNANNINNGQSVSVCAGSAIIFQSANSGLNNTTWTFQNGNPSTASGNGPISVIFPTIGNDTVTQKSSAGTQQITVIVTNVMPVAAFSWAPVSGCGNIPVQFNNTSTGSGLSYSWNFGDGVGSSASTNPLYSFVSAVGAPGTTTFPVRLTVTNSGGCSNSITQNVAVQNYPDNSIGNNNDPNVGSIQFNGLPTFSVCSNVSSYNFNFSNLSSTQPTNSSYTIQWGDGSPGTTVSSWPVTHSFSAGLDSLIVTVTGQNGCASTKKYYVFLGNTSPAIDLGRGTSTVSCINQIQNFNVNPVSGSLNPNGTNYTYNFTDGSGTITTTQPPPFTISHKFLTGSCGFTSTNGLQSFANSFGFSLIASNPCGTTPASIVNILISDTPKASFVPPPSNTVCINSEVTFQSNSTGSIVNAQGICTAIGTQVWVVTPITGLPTGFTIGPGSTGSLDNSPTNGSAWTNGTQTIGITFTAAGTYRVVLYAANNGCGVDSTTKADTICVSSPPQASFTMGSTKSCSGTVTFTNTSPVSGCLSNSVNWKVNYSDPNSCSAGSGTPYKFVQGSSNTSSSPVIEFDSAGAITQLC